MRWVALFLTLLLGVALAVLVVELRRPIEIAESVTIEAPVEEVWSYLGDSGNARQWSVFFHHIAPLDSLDGRLGAERRCFRNPDRSGIRWDETVIALVPHRERRIHVYNLAGFALPRADRSEFETRQLYERPSPGTTRLTFTAELREPRDLLTRLLFRLTRSETERIFRRNLANIKAAVEQKDAYKRLHDWEPTNFVDGRSAGGVSVR
ncbi:MAG TPA: SRPBCC family protein, partial [Longimicrobiaceae bacterium]|nr:SRPBCC family protein [Longimicrobiaceae bacterium]